MNHLKQRLTIVKLLCFKVHEEIIRNAKSLKGSNLFVRETFSERIEQRRRELWPRVLKERHNRKIAHMSYDKLIIKNRQ